MADQSKSAPQPFNASLFGAGGGSSLSFDLDTSGITSQIVIGPVSKGKDSASQSFSTPPQTRSDSPSGASLAGSKTRPAPTAASLFPSPSSGSTPVGFSALFAHPPADPPGPMQTPETELETVDLGSPTSTSTVEPPSHPQPLIPPVPMDSVSPHGPPAPSGPPPTSSQPPVAAVTPMPLQAATDGGGGGGEESNPYRLSARHMGRPLHQAMVPPTQAPFLGSSIMPPAPPPTMDTMGIPPSTSSSSGYSPILPPPTSGGYQGVPSQMAPPMYYTGSAAGMYQPVRPHWFYLRSGDRYWTPFTLVDSSRLEQLYQKEMAGSLPSDQMLSTDGGRYDVSFTRRTRRAVYWEEEESVVRRGTWFYRSDGERWYMPYEEQLAAKLEEEYQMGVTQNMWNRRVPLSANDVIVMHSASSMVHYPPPPAGLPLDIDEQYTRPKAVKREFSEMDQVSQGEQSRVDHLVFVVHGVGPVHDLSFRSIVDCVDDFREVSQLMLQTHKFRDQAPCDGDDGGRTEYLPVHWHAALHCEVKGQGVNKRLQPITLKSIRRLREFTNDWLLDILYYSSPVYCQTIVDQVVGEMNRLFDLFCKRNPNFKGGVSIAGHSLGSCIAFDILANQKGPEGQVDGEGEGDKEEEEEEKLPTLPEVLNSMGLGDQLGTFQKEQIDYESLVMLSVDDLRELGVPMGPRKKLAELISREKERVERVQRVRDAKREQAAAKVKEEGQQRQKVMALESSGLRMVPFAVSKSMDGTGQIHVEYPQLNFTPENLFALGSPIGMFLSVRGVDSIGPNYELPTCQHVFNIFHPYDAVAYRVEPLVDPTFTGKPVLMPHHKGRKRFHLELYENLGRMGASLKENLMVGMRNMWESLSEFARSHTSSTAALTQGQEEEQPDMPTELKPHSQEENATARDEADMASLDFLNGRLNKGQRIDYVLQERPLEKLNEYLFALSSHLTYWRSEDTALFILKQAYKEHNPEMVKS